VKVLDRPEVHTEKEYELLESAVVIIGSLARVRAESVEDYVPTSAAFSSTNISTLSHSSPSATLWLRSLWLAPLYVTLPFTHFVYNFFYYYYYYYYYYYDYDHYHNNDNHDDDFL
jgi:hypothetical protein